MNVRRILKWSGMAVLTTVLVTWGAWRVVLKVHERAFVTHFKDAPAGERAPHRTVFGVQVGRSTVSEVTSTAAARGITCVDTSTRAIMSAVREKKERAFVDRLMKGEFKRSEPTLPDGYGKRLLGYMANPQVRLACDTVEGSVVADGSDLKGRWLIIFDSEDHPARHTSFRMDLKDPAVAAARFQQQVAHFTAQYGPPHQQNTTLPVRDTGEPTFAPTVTYNAQWRWSDLTVEVKGMFLGPSHAAFVESRVEVPLGVRPDAPFVPSAQVVATQP